MKVPSLLAVEVGAGVLVLVAVLWMFRKGAAGAGQTAGQAVGDAVGGAVVGLGSSIGVPPTDAGKCAACKAAGDSWGASLYCPAGDFVSWVMDGKPAPAPQTDWGVTGVNW